MTAPVGSATPCHEAFASKDASHGVPAAGHAASPACCVAACLAQCAPLLPTGPWAGFVSARTPLPGQATVHYVSVVHRPPLPPPQILVSI
ncbi:MAG: hypothetical protein GAK30_02616 [Paracidovorax wautersii]|uniref:Uncharacterized protein n=1 Tax=Paracidovorax wautersii TaxID=1177982 RepID=A0A7V8JPY4_9BURK|nr:MAG: hypothetical protein GAK30_02616 [Paracidovorax wautersii]